MKKRMVCGLCGQPHQGVFCSLEDNALAILRDEREVQVFKKNEIIFHEGSPSKALYGIHTGKVKLYKTNSSGTHHVIRILKSTDIVGFRPLLSDENYAATAQAIEPTKVYRIKKTTLLKMLAASKELAIELLNKLSSELRISEQQLVSLLYHPVKRRLANLLLTLVDDQFDIKDNSRLRVSKLKRIEMSQIIGTTPETMSRMLKKMNEDKILEINRKEIFVTNLKVLQSISKGK